MLLLKNGSIEASKNEITIITSDYVNITDCHLEGNLGGGIVLRGGSYNFIDHNEIYGASGGISTMLNNASGIVNTSNYNLITNNLVHDNIINPENSDGISVSTGSRNNTVANNVVYNNADDGIDASTGWGMLPGVSCNYYETITDNIAFNNGYGEAGDGNGIKVSTNCGGGHLVAKNIVFDNRASGFDQCMEPGNPQNRFYNNLMYKNSVYGSNLESDEGYLHEAAILYNNIMVSNSILDVKNRWRISINTSDYNLWSTNWTEGPHSSISEGQHSMLADPKFNNPNKVIDTNFSPSWTIEQKLGYIRNQVREKFSLQAGSPAIDNGTIIPGYHCSTSGAHLGENCREWYGDAPDMGVYEYS